MHSVHGCNQHSFIYCSLHFHCSFHFKQAFGGCSWEEGQGQDTLLRLLLLLLLLIIILIITCSQAFGGCTWQEGQGKGGGREEAGQGQKAGWGWAA